MLLLFVAIVIWLQNIDISFSFHAILPKVDMDHAMACNPYALAARTI
jgi:hypothetical protein